MAFDSSVDAASDRCPTRSRRARRRPPDVLARIAPTLRQGDGVLRQGAWLVADRSGALDPPAAEALLGLLHRVVDDLERHRAATA